MAKPDVCIISPALAKANNGNWRTAQRWSAFLRERYRVRIVSADAAALPAQAPHAVIALHARRSALALAEFCAAFPDMPSILVLTGTDLYRDIRADRAAQNSLRLATRLVLLQADGLGELNASQRAKASVIHQSAPTLTPKTRSPRARYFEVTTIGHLREEKDPLTYLRAAEKISASHIRLSQVGAALDPALGELAAACQEGYPRYRWLGSLTHAATRQHLKRSDLLVVSSHMEGGANVIVEALTSGVPVIASNISGNRGMLGAEYAGYFPVGDSNALARLIEHASADPEFYARLQAQCHARASLFSVQAERAALLQLMDNCIHLKRGHP